MKRKYHHINLIEIESFISKKHKKYFGCIWDTSNAQANKEVFERLVRSGCKVIISIGKEADIIHDTCDGIAAEIEAIDGNKCEIDTRGSAEKDISLSEAIEEMEYSLFSEDDLSIQEVVIIK